MLADSSITSTIPYDQQGVLHGHLHLPHSRDDSAYGAIMIPISVINNGKGPTVLLTGGNHGDEYYGPHGSIRHWPDEFVAQANEPGGSHFTEAAFTRQALHAAGLKFRHPITEQWMSIRAPLPADIRRVIQRFVPAATAASLRN